MLVLYFSIIAKISYAFFADYEFLEDESTFKEAQVRCEKPLMKQVTLVKARFDAAHKYFSAKYKETTAKFRRAKFANAWNFTVAEHEKAIARHDETEKKSDATADRKHAVIAAHEITVAELLTANTARGASK